MATDAEHEALAEVVAAVLIRAGLPVRRALVGQGLNVDPGVEIEIDDGVLVRWTSSPELRDAAANSIEIEDFDAPAVRFSGFVAKTMRDAVKVILGADGYESGPADELRPFTLKVAARRSPETGG
jgi:hypothetical protein